MKEWIRLLSGRPFAEFTAESFKEYVRTLYEKRTKRKAARAVRLKKEKAAISWSLSQKKKLLSIKVNRSPLYITPEELDLISTESGRPANEVFLAAKKKKLPIQTHKEAEELKTFTAEIPW